MDLSRVYTKTSKGILEGNTVSRFLKREHGRVLTLIDGKSSVGDLLEKNSRLSESRLAEILDELSELGMIRELHGALAVDDLGFSSTIIVGESNTQAFFEAQVHLERELRLAEDHEARVKEEDRATLLQDVKADIEAEAEAIRRELDERNAQEAAQAKAKEQSQREAEAKAKAKAKAQAEEKARQAREAANAHAKAVAEHARKQLEAETKARAEAEARAKALEAEAFVQAEAARKAKQEAAQRAQAESDAKARMETEKKAREQAEKQAQAAEKAREAAERKARKEAEENARLAKEAEEKANARREQEAKKQAEEEAQRRAEMEARMRAMEQEKRRAEEEAKALSKALDEARIATELETRVKRRIEARAREEEQARLRAEAETRAKLEEESRLRQAAEARAQEAAEAHRLAEEARVKAEQDAKAQLEAERVARKEAEARAIAEAEAQRQAEAARLVAEQRAEEERIAREEAEREAQAIAQARAKAEEEAREHAEAEQRRVEAEAQAAEQARLAAEQQAEEQRRLREEAVHAEIEARIRAEEEAQRRAEEEAQRRAEEERQRVEAEARAVAEAEEAVRLEAEAAKRQLEEQERQEQARLAREEVARQQAVAEAAEAAARAVADARERAETEARARDEARQQARDRAEAAARAEAEEALQRAAEATRREEAEEAHLRAEAQARAMAASKGGAVFPFLVRKRTRVQFNKKLIKPITYGVLGLLVFVLAAIHLVSFTFYIPNLERQLSGSLGQRVVIKDIRFSVYPAPHLKLEGVAIGDLADVRAGTVRLFPVYESWFSDKKTMRRVELEAVALSEDSVRALSVWSQSQTKAVPVQFEQVVLKDAKLANRLLDLFTFDATIKMDHGRFAKGQIKSTDQRVSIDVTPQGEGLAIQLASTRSVLPLEPRIQFDELKISAITRPGGMTLSHIEGQLYGGSLSGSGQLEWRDGWTLTSDLGVRQVAIEPALTLFTQNMKAKGALEAKIRLTTKSATLETLMDAPQVQATFRVRDGEISGVDLARAIQSARSSGSMGGKTHFSELSGYLQLANGRYQYRQLKLLTGMLSATGNLEFSAERNLSGNLAGEMRTHASALRVPFTLSGTLDTPLLKVVTPARRAAPPKPVEEEEQ